MRGVFSCFFFVFFFGKEEVELEEAFRAAKQGFGVELRFRPRLA
jgi:hypothetical protein